MSVVPDSLTLVELSVSAIVNPATSSSVVVTETDCGDRGSKLLSEAPSFIAISIVLVIVPSIMLSSMPVTVTVCGVFQLALVKVRALFTVASPVSFEAIINTTSVSGCASRTTVKVSVVPVSATLVEPLVSAIVNPATSSSVVVAKRV